MGRLDGPPGADLQIPFIREVWDQDVSNFDYTKGFKELVNRLL